MYFIGECIEDVLVGVGVEGDVEVCVEGFGGCYECECFDGGEFVVGDVGGMGVGFGGEVFD